MNTLTNTMTTDTTMDFTTTGLKAINMTTTDTTIEGSLPRCHLMNLKPIPNMSMDFISLELILNRIN